MFKSRKAVQVTGKERPNLVSPDCLLSIIGNQHCIWLIERDQSLNVSGIRSIDKEPLKLVWIGG